MNQWFLPVLALALEMAMISLAVIDRFERDETRIQSLERRFNSTVNSGSPDVKEPGSKAE